MVLTALLVLLCLSTPAYAQTLDEAKASLEKSEATLSEMGSMNFSVSRINDTLAEARNLFVSQELINESGGKPDFSLVLAKTKEIEQIRKDALGAYDEMIALEKTMAGLTDVNRTLLDSYLTDVKLEFQNERYDKTREKIDAAYARISEQQAFATRLATLLEAGRRNVAGFLFYNWPSLSAGAVAAIALAVVLRSRFSRCRTRRKIDALLTEKRVILDLVKETQRLYFDVGKIPEDTYRIRVKKFGELARDIDRQLPMLRAQLQSGGLLKAG